jgi:hypothetical protein
MRENPISLLVYAVIAIVLLLVLLKIVGLLG